MDNSDKEFLTFLGAIILMIIIGLSLPLCVFSAYETYKKEETNRLFIMEASKIAHAFLLGNKENK